MIVYDLQDLTMFYVQLYGNTSISKNIYTCSTIMLLNCDKLKTYSKRPQKYKNMFQEYNVAQLIEKNCKA